MSEIIKINRYENISKRWERDKYTISDIDYILGKRIIEYDMKEAGWNLIRQYKLVSNKHIARLKRLTKYQRTIAIGMMCRDDKKLNKSLARCFKLARRKFFLKNDIQDEHVISVKKDAIYIIGKICKHTKFGEFIDFRPKNTYTSFHMFGNMELYYRSSTNQLDIKGISDSNLIYHNEYMLKFLKKSFKHIEMNNKKELVRMVKKFVDKYKNLKLDIGYYRELNACSCFTLKEELNKSEFFNYNYINYDKKKDLNISFNYMNFVLPIIQRFYF